MLPDTARKRSLWPATDRCCPQGHSMSTPYMWFPFAPSSGWAAHRPLQPQNACRCDYLCHRQHRHELGFFRSTLQRLKKKPGTAHNVCAVPDRGSAVIRLSAGGYWKFFWYSATARSSSSSARPYSSWEPSRAARTPLRALLIRSIAACASPGAALAGALPD